MAEEDGAGRLRGGRSGGSGGSGGGGDGDSGSGERSGAGGGSGGSGGGGGRSEGGGGRSGSGVDEGRRDGQRDRAPQGMRRFTMHRQNDVSGVSGTGTVLEGVQFSTGVVVIHWLTPPPRGSISVFDSLDQFLSIHVRPHPDNRTILEFEDGERLVCGPEGTLVVLPAD